MKDICEEAIRLIENGESFIQATILQSSGSTPRGAGAAMLILSDGSIRGTVGGGPLEGGIVKAAPDIMRERRSRVVNVVFDGNDAAALGAICGGAATVLLDYIDAGRLGNLDFYKALREALKSGSKATLLTAPPHTGGIEERSQCLIMQNGELYGADGLDPEIIKKLKAGSGSYDMFTRLDSHNVYLRPVNANGAAYIFGAGHCGEKLSPILKTVGFATIVIDDRKEFANPERFPDADEIIVPETMEAPFDDIHMDGDSYIVIVTRGHMHDELVARRALRTPAGYIGMIGSRKKRETIYRHLLADGYAQSDIDRVYSPIGVDIGAETPEEIAVSIAAEMIRVRAEKRL